MLRAQLMNGVAVCGGNATFQHLSQDKRKLFSTAWQLPFLQDLWLIFCPVGGIWGVVDNNDAAASTAKSLVSFNG